MKERTMKTSTTAPRSRTFASIAAISLAVICSTAAAQTTNRVNPSGVEPDDDFAQAYTEYEVCHWRVAWERFARLADAGHPQAIQIALAMQRFGPLLYGETFELPPQRQTAWKAALLSRSN